MKDAIEILKEKRDGLNAAIAILEGGTTTTTAAPRAKPKAKNTDEAVEVKEKEPTIEDVVAACKAHQEKNGREATIAIIESFGVKNVQKLEPAKFKDILKELAK